MSISQIIKPNIFLKITSIVKELAQRELLTIGVKQKVFFPYRVSLIHPAFNESKNNPPIHYTNKHNARLFHYIQGANSTCLEENHIIEVIDHALSLLAPYNGYALTCQEYVEQVPIAKKLYDSPKLTKILFTSEGQRKVFRRYFPDDELFKKTKVLPLAWHDNTDKAKKQFAFYCFTLPDKRCSNSTGRLGSLCCKQSKRYPHTRLTRYTKKDRASTSQLNYSHQASSFIKGAKRTVIYHKRCGNNNNAYRWCHAY